LEAGDSLVFDLVDELFYNGACLESSSSYPFTSVCHPDLKTFVWTLHVINSQLGFKEKLS
jgi:hypothetical protein